jgi:hypothetical protein
MNDQRQPADAIQLPFSDITRTPNKSVLSFRFALSNRGFGPHYSDSLNSHFPVFSCPGSEEERTAHNTKERTEKLCPLTVISHQIALDKMSSAKILVEPAG